MFEKVMKGWLLVTKKRVKREAERRRKSRGRTRG